MNSLPYYFSDTNTPVQHIFLLVFGNFSVVFAQKSKKICQFFAIFSLCVSISYEKVEKIIAQNP